jgi:hypothetical protein
MVTRNVRGGPISPCYRLALGVMLRSWLETAPRYPFLLLHTAELEPGLGAIINASGGRIQPLSVRQLEQSNAPRSDWAAMATKQYAWTLTDYDRVAYYDADHIFLSNADAIFDECGCEHTVCGAFDPRLPLRNYSKVFGNESAGVTLRKTLNAGTLVLKPDLQRAAFIREQWARRAEFMAPEDSKAVASGSDQAFLNMLFGDDFEVVHEGFNLMFLDRLTIHRGTDFVLYLTPNGTVLLPDVPTVPHVRVWIRGVKPATVSFMSKVRERFVEPDPYLRELNKDPLCDPDKKRERNHILPDKPRTGRRQVRPPAVPTR